ncbi:MAG: sulfite exporter TauE/SafE family protein [Spirochaetota bacterium]
MLELSELTLVHWALLVSGSIIIGISRTGIRGSSFLAIPLFAFLFGGKVSVGIVLIAMMTGDLVAIRYYADKIQWPIIWRLLPWIAAGLVAGVFIGDAIEGGVYNKILAGAVMVTVVLLVWNELRRGEIRIKNNLPVKGTLGMIGGFTSMIGNAAGPIMNLYFIAMGLKKEHFIGTIAWMFFFVNIAKVPVHIFVWETLTPASLLINAVIAPIVLLGTYLGIVIARKLPERSFRWVIVVLSFVSSLRLFFQ